MILRFLAVLLFFYLFLNNAHTQQSKLDSLLRTEREYAKEDTGKFKLLNDIAYYFQFTEPIKGVAYAEKALVLSTKLNYSQGIAEAYYSMGSNYYRSSQISKALESFQKASKIFQSQNSLINLAKSYNGIASVYKSYKGHSQEALLYYDMAIAIIKTQDDKKLLPSLVNNKGNVYRFIDSVALAIQCFNESLLLGKQYAPENKQLTARTFSGLGNLYIGSSDSALREAGFTGNQYDTAIYWIHKAIAIFDSLDSDDGISTAYLELGQAHLSKNNYPLALKYEVMAKQISHQKGFRGIELEAASTISKIYAAIGRYDSAYAYHMMFTDLKESAFSDEKDRELAQKEMQYHFDKKEDSLHFQNALLSQNNALSKLQLRQQWLYSTAALLVLLGLGGFLYYRNRNKQVKLTLQLEKERAEQKQRESEFERKVSDAALHSLRSQINPHFIFNCLNSIKLYAVENNQDAATAYLGKFSRLMRLVLENSKSDRISLQQEIETLQLYMEMEAMRFKEKLHHKINIADNVDLEYIEIPPMLIQPYVENAIWHGLMPKEEGGALTLNFSCQDNNLYITVTDNGVGRARSAQVRSQSATAHKSFGMSITHERIELINQMYKTNISVTVNDLFDGQGNANGTEIIMDIPIE